MCPILRGKMGLDTPPALGGAGVRDGRGGRSPPTDVVCLVWGEVRVERLFWGLRPLAFWGGLSCGLAALYLGTHDVWLLFPLRDLPARSAGRRRGSLVVAEARPSAQLAIPGLTANSAARAKPSAYDTRKPVKDSFNLRLAPKAFFFGAPHPFLWARPKKWGGTWVLQGPAPAYFTPRR